MPIDESGGEHVKGGGALGLRKRSAKGWEMLDGIGGGAPPLLIVNTFIGKCSPAALRQKRI